MANEAAQTTEVGTPTQTTNESGAPATQQQSNLDDSAQGGDGDGGRSIDSLPKWAQKHIQDLRGEAGNYRTKLRDAEDKQRRERLSEDEKLVEDAVNEALTQERAKFTDKLKRLEVKQRLAEAKVINPERSLRLIDLDKITLTDDGEIKGLDEEIESLKTDYPNLIQGGTNPNIHDEGNPASKGVDMNDVLRRMAGRA